MSRRTVVPKYRFSEFNDSPEWVIAPLSEFSVPIKKRAGANKYVSMSVTSGVGLIPQTEKFGREIAGNSYKNYLVIQRGDFAYNKSATKLFPEGYIAMLSEYDEAALPNSIFTCFRITDEEVCVNFIDHLFQSNYHGVWLRKFITVGARAHGSLNVDDKNLWDLPVALPKFQEQQKIVDCLSSLDELVAAENKKLELLKAHKKGLTQKLFPAEGKTVPEWRFPEFRDSGEWMERKIEGALAEKISNGIMNKPGRNKLNIKHINVINLYSPSYIHLDELEYIDATENNLRRCNVEIGDIFLTRSSLKVEGIAQANILLDDSTLVFDDHIMRLKLTDEFEPFFIKESLNHAPAKKQFMAKSKTATMTTIGQEDIASSIIFFPRKPEQTVIGNFLRNIDELIAAQAEKNETLKLHKKGLKQGLFPSAQEIME